MAGRHVFLRGCGVPDEVIDFLLPSIRNSPIEFHSCFPSHSAKDKRFCDHLYADLQAKGVRCWSFPEDATWGRDVWGEIDKAVKV